MINLQIRENSNFENFEKQISNLTSKEIHIFYNHFIDDYIKLDNIYGFTESFNKDFILEQLSINSGTGELAYIPFGIKDIFNTKYLATSMGSELWNGFKAGNNARVIDNIVHSGGIVFSKTTTAEFAVHFISPGKTLNPYNIKHITGTSSSGSAVAVACGAIPISIGTQTAGSVIRPASFCGIYGFKPSFGAIDRTGVLKTNDTFDTIGFLSADIYGINKTFKNVFQNGKDYPYSINFFESFNKYQKNHSKLKIGFIDTSLNIIKNFSNEVMTDFESIKSLVSKFYNFFDISGIKFLNDIHLIHEEMYAKSLSYYFKNELKQNKKISNIMVEMMNKGEKISAEHYVKIAKTQPLYINKMNKIFENIDFIIIPSTATSAPKLGNTEIDDTCLIWTFLGYPSITIPLFIDHNGLPFGLQIIAKKYHDLALLDFAKDFIKFFK
jgi:Asp-tRNA(Asn)/Glu-tRNA(Gln) amidotransferase A subunit family amidase